MRELLPTREQPVHVVCKVCRASDCKGSKEKEESKVSQDWMESMVRTVHVELTVQMVSMVFLDQQALGARLDRTPSEETVRREKKARQGVVAALVLLEVMVLLEVQVLLEAQEPQGLSGLLVAMVSTV